MHGRRSLRYSNTVRRCLSMICFSITFGLCLSNSSSQISAPQDTAGPESHFHHLHLNTTDPRAAIEFYTSKFDCEKAKFAGVTDAVWAQKSWILFTKVNQAPPWELISSIWHFGWGAEDMPSVYKKHVETGTRFFTPLTDISDIGGRPSERKFYYAYVESPDRALIELNTANHHRFGHLHLFSEDPIAAAEWYMKHLGATSARPLPTSREPRFYRGFQIGPSASVVKDNVNIIIFPIQYSKQAYPEHWKGQSGIVSTRGRVVDHIGFSFDNLGQALEKMRHSGIKITQEIRSVAGGGVKFAFVEGPDKISIELIEGHPRRD